MSRLGDLLFFAPQIPFSSVDLRGGGLPNQFFRRIDGFYLQPAIELAHRRHDFAAGLMAVCAADALAGFITGASGTTERMIAFFRRVPGLDDQDTAALFCDHFRNGLVHDARVKYGSEFSVDLRGVAQRNGDRLVVNPLLLAKSVRRVLQDYRDRLNRDTAELKSLRARIRRRFKVELELKS
jgi:hypothetical protein